MKNLTLTAEKTNSVFSNIIEKCSSFEEFAVKVYQMDLPVMNVVSSWDDKNNWNGWYERPSDFVSIEIFLSLSLNWYSVVPMKGGGFYPLPMLLKDCGKDWFSN